MYRDSDQFIVPKKPGNAGGGKGLAATQGTKGKHTPHTEVETRMATKLRTLTEKAQRNPKLRFTSLAHHLNEEFLTGCYEEIRRKSAGELKQDTKLVNSTPNWYEASILISAYIYEDAGRGLSVDGWRMPATDASCGNGAYNCTGSEMGQLYYNELGNIAGGPPTNNSFLSGGIGPTGYFDNLTASYYWSSTIASSIDAWGFGFDSGGQGIKQMADTGFVWAVHDGDVAPPVVTPEPSTYLLLGSGITALIFWRRKRKT